MEEEHFIVKSLVYIIVVFRKEYKKEEEVAEEEEQRADCKGFCNSFHLNEFTCSSPGLHQLLKVYPP